MVPAVCWHRRRLFVVEAKCASRDRIGGRWTRVPRMAYLRAALRIVDGRSRDGMVVEPGRVHATGDLLIRFAGNSCELIENHEDAVKSARATRHPTLSHSSSYLNSSFQNSVHVGSKPSQNGKMRCNGAVEKFSTGRVWSFNRWCPISALMPMRIGTRSVKCPRYGYWSKNSLCIRYFVRLYWISATQTRMVLASISVVVCRLDHMVCSPTSVISTISGIVRIRAFWRHPDLPFVLGDRERYA